jgi:hypothetical protein
MDRVSRPIAFEWFYFRGAGDRLFRVTDIGIEEVTGRARVELEIELAPWLLTPARMTVAC